MDLLIKRSWRGRRRSWKEGENERDGGRGEGNRKHLKYSSLFFLLFKKI
jgi:hypothetical protein